VKKIVLYLLLTLSFTSCYTANVKAKVIPSLDYARSIQPVQPEVPQVKWVDGTTPPQAAFGTLEQGATYPPINPADQFRSEARAGLDFRENSSSSSLWHESQGKGGLYHDFRAWKPMDLITILVSEISEGKKEADTNILNQNSVTAAISKFLGIESSILSRNKQMDPAALVDATTQSNFNGQGETIRKGSLKGTISGMVMEVLPSGILRIEGKKIISVNNEEQVMIISGLVRVRDIDSLNRVQSSQVANMRIDYFGNGIVNDVQSPGLIGKLFNMIWPF
jgi:flagellar L-ring protein FlgH